VTAAQLLAIMPKSSTCSETVECRTAEQAASKSLTDFVITGKAQQAALIAIMASESGEFGFNTNQAGHVGQGTRNMLSGAFNLKYAQAIPELQSQLAAAGGNGAGAKTGVLAGGCECAGLRNRSIMDSCAKGEPAA
jgi:predicted chitinase